MKIFNIKIENFTNPPEFVEKWSSSYNFPNNEKYEEHIGSVLKNKDSLLKLFEWKNGTGDVISKNKMKVVNSFLDKYDIIQSLGTEFSWTVFEEEFKPTKSSTIWKIFLLHTINPNEFPIYDQHVYRFYNFYKNGTIEEIPNKSKDKYHSYKNDYLPWFNKVKMEYNLDSKMMDESFFEYGSFLKKISNHPISIY